MPAPDDRRGYGDSQEESRLRELDSFRILDSEPEAEFDAIVRFVAGIFDVPIAFVSLIESERQWLKAAVGIDGSSFSRRLSLCGHTILSDDILVVPDARLDARFAENPYVIGDPNIRFYAGAPLITAAGSRIGSICIIDTKPRLPLSERECHLLRQASQTTMRLIDNRRDAFVSGTMTAFADTTDLALLSTDRHGHVVFLNRAAELLFGYPRAEIVGRNVDLIIPERFRLDHAHAMAKLRDGAPSRLAGKTIELPAVHRDGHEIAIEFSFFQWKSPSGLGMGSVMRDITARRQRDMRLLRLAHHDPLTGLVNRRHLNEYLDGLMASETRFSVLMLDLDRFKEVNDHIGHAAGDTLLQTIALRLTAALDQAALLSRWGGDEFLVVLPDLADPVEFGRQASKLLDVFAKPFDVSGNNVIIGASVGGAIWPNHGSDRDEVIASADLALYRAKNDGGRHFRLFDFPMRDRVTARHMLRDDLRRAIRQDELRLFYQPQVSFTTGAIVGVEALMRWQHPERGLLLPKAFMHGLEEGSLALHAGWWTLEEACRQAAAWRQDGIPPMKMSVNLFGAQIRSGNLAKVVTEALARHDLTPDYLELEVTETIALQNDDAMLEPLRELRNIGIGIAFDDFGTGFASLSSLRRVPLTSLKVDQSFVRNMLTDKHDAAIVRAIVSMGLDFDVTVIAEGLETKRQADMLRAMGCQVGQGHWFGKAVDPDVLAKRLSRAGGAQRNGRG
ncbi:putative bifunctional diguanylate cyclase/phosphodiesterase [Lichenihabitans psoromatis]|uniref:putative bifunctional diguanylate cyclase/phosphodiesterase n=1 Tax=Lichenihabitans psoromatis TaxID=2528642 RepID=UPI001FE04EF6|nr:EAL domain-containing protein [Lichenihabitans psoromatis]